MNTVIFLKKAAIALIIAAVAFAGCKKDDPVKVSGVSLNKTALTLMEGLSETLVVTVAPYAAENKAVTWEVTGDAATVDAGGKVTAVKVGTAVITVTTTDGGKMASCIVTVNEFVAAVTGVTLDNTAELDPGATLKLTATVVPDNATEKGVAWSSDNIGIATVDTEGTVTAIAPGTAVITATTKDGGFKATCTVTVKAIGVTSVTPSEATPRLFAGKTATLTAIITPDNVTDKTVEWSSSDERIATVSDAGVVTAVAEGTATITVTAKNGHNGKCTVTVMEPEITMTTAKTGRVWFEMSGNGWGYVDWGDGSRPEVFSLSGDRSCSHDYSGTTSHTIAIDGQGITYLSCVGLQLTALDVTKNTALDDLRCWNNQLTALDMTKNTALTSLNCGENRLTELDMTNNTALTELYCGNNQLTGLYVAKSTALTRLDCYNNQLIVLDVTKNTALEWLSCWNNQLTAINVTKNTALTYMNCESNQLTSLDVTKNTALANLNCGNNQLTNLDMTKNTELTYLYCESNQLTNLDMTNNTVLTSLHCGNNQFTAEGLNALFSTLHDHAGDKSIYAYSFYGFGCDPSIATAKGWRVSPY